MRRRHAVRYGVIAAVVVALAVAFVIDWAPVAGERITRSASRALGRSVTIAGPIRIRPTFAGLEGRATGIVIGSPDWARSDEFASIDTAEIAFAWLPLLTGAFEPERIRIKGALFELESRPAGTGHEATWQVGSLDPGRDPRESGILRFARLPRIELEDAAFAVTDAYGQLHDITVRRFLLRRKGQGAVVSALLGEGDSPVKLGWTVSSVKALETKASEMALSIESAAGTVTASGNLALQPDVGFDLESHWDLSALGRFGKDLGLTGLPQDMPLKAGIRMAGRADAFAIQLDRVESGRSRVHGVLQGRLARQGGLGSAYNLLELTGELASQHLDPTPAAALMKARKTGEKGESASTSLVDFLFGPGLVVKLDLEVSALELAINDSVFKNTSGRIISDARLFRLSNVSGRLGKGSLAFDLVMDRAGTAVQDVVLLFSARDLDLGWLFTGLGLDPLLVAPADFAGELRGGGANMDEMLTGLNGAVHFASGHGALRGAAARGLEFSGVNLPRLDGAEAFPLDCLAGRVSFVAGVGVFDGFTMQGAGYAVTAKGYANLGRQRIEMRFHPVAKENEARPDMAEGVPYEVSGTLTAPRIGRTAADAEEMEIPARPAASRKLPPLRGEVARNNPCLAGIRPAQEAEQGAGQ